MRFISRFKRQLLSHTLLARLVLGLVLIILVAVGFLLHGIIKQASLPASILVWRIQDPLQITLVTPQGKHTLDPDLVVPSLNLPLSEVLAVGNTRQPPTGGQILAKSAVAELTGLPVDYIVILPAFQTDLPATTWFLRFNLLRRI